MFFIKLLPDLSFYYSDVKIPCKILLYLQKFFETSIPVQDVQTLTGLRSTPTKKLFFLIDEGGQGCIGFICFCHFAALRIFTAKQINCYRANTKHTIYLKKFIKENRE